MGNYINFTVFCKNIVYLRKKHNLTQVEMARILGVGVRTMRSLERGIVPPLLRVGVLRRIHDCFHITADEIMQRLEENYTETD